MTLPTRIAIYWQDMGPESGVAYRATYPEGSAPEQESGPLEADETTYGLQEQVLDVLSIPRGCFYEIAWEVEPALQARLDRMSDEQAEGEVLA